jgi:cell division ATPase FtsA
MSKEPVIVGLDIGSQTIKILGALKDDNSDLTGYNFLKKFPLLVLGGVESKTRKF